MKKYPAWQYNPRPKDFGPENHLTGALGKLRKLVTQCNQNGDGAYRLPGTTFTMKISPEMEQRLWDD